MSPPSGALHHGLGLGATVGSGISVPSLCPIRVERQQTPWSDGPETQGPIHFISRPLVHRDPPNAK